jgi:ELP3 family radical SAM enzyme/protein acetyltransferase
LSTRTPARCSYTLSSIKSNMADIEDSVRPQATQVTPAHKHIVKYLLGLPSSSWDTPAALRESIWPLCRAMKIGPPSKRALGIAYRAALEADPTLVPNPAFQSAMVHKAVRSASGILNISVSLPAGEFSCKYNCHFCPNEPGMPRSYLSNEDVFKRAAQVGFDTVQQVYLRFMNLATNGHTIDKVEFRVLGGTFSCYEHTVADDFIRDLYYAANTYYEERGRPRGTIEEEQARNVTAKVHVVGLGVETRPDEITPAEILRFRRYGITRVEIGVQHTDDALLRRVNRGHGVKQSRAAVRLLKDYGFKVEMHIMTDLPGATPEGDKECYRQVLMCNPMTGDADLIPDYLKDYPCLDVDFTRIKEWKAAGIWQPYAERTPDARELKEVLIYRQQITPPWVRVNRIQRDFQEAGPNCLGYTSEGIRSNLAQIVKDEAEARGIYCQCIRCCEVRTERFDPADIQYKVTSFMGSGAKEFYLAAMVERERRPLLLGFLRLRLSEALRTSIIPELRGRTAMIRELHVYGSLKAVGTDGPNGAQHLGIGRRLLATAEEIAVHHGYEQMAVISGIGVRGYYQKNGYERKGSYMMKSLAKGKVSMLIACAILLALIAMLIALY